MNTNTNAASVPGPEDQKFNAWYESKFKPAMERGPLDKYVARQAWFAALSTAAQPPGMVMVPVEPTLEMLDRGHHQIDFDRSGQRTDVLVDPSHADTLGCGTTIEQDMRDCWAAMLAAAPKAAKAEPQGKADTALLNSADPVAKAEPVQQPERVPLTADDLREPKNGEEWRVAWWNESARLMLPANKRLDRFQSYKNGTLMFTLKERAAAEPAHKEQP